MARYEPGEKGIEQIFDGVDLSGFTPVDVFRSVLSRAPETLWHYPDGYDQKSHFITALSSSEFRARVLEIFLCAHPEKRRLVFIHVPKCAGTDLRHKLTPRFLSLPEILMSTEWMPDPDFFAALADAGRRIGEIEQILVYGHFELDWYLARIGSRAGDRLFTTIRDPTEIMISLANYSVGLMVMDPEATGLHSRAAFRRLGLKRLPDGAPPELLKEFAIRILLDRELMPENPICRHLASAGRGYADAVRNIVTNDLEITDVTRYNLWLSREWGIDSTSRHNVSTKFLSPSDVEAHRDYLTARTAEDQKLFELISWALAETGKPAIRGTELLATVASRRGPYEIDGGRGEILRCG